MRRAAAKAQLISAEEAAGLVRSGMWIDYGAILCQPDVFDRALAARKAELSDVKIRSCLSMKPRAVLEADPEGHHFHWFSTHFSAYDRRMNVNGRCNYLPVHLGEVPDYYRRFIDPVDIVILKTCRIDDDGMFNFGPANLWHRAIIERARMVIVEVTDGLPYCFGVRNGVHSSEVDYIIEGDNAPAPEIANLPPSEIDRAVSRLIAEQIDDGACLQIGIGAMPNAVCALLLESGVKELGINTEMMTDGLADLYRAGRVTGQHKLLDPDKITYTFALGSQALYDTLNRNADMLCLPVDDTNLPHNILLNDKVVSINNTTQIDLQGQAASESDGHRHISGTGGQSQFVRGAYASRGGKSFICLSSTYEKNGVRKSRIVPSLTPGNIVTAPRTDVMYVVTEYGIASLKGKSVAQRALALIALAHPDFREELERQAHAHHLITPGICGALSAGCASEESIIRIQPNET
jgi:acyl-CoA hydrolase